MDCVAEDRLAFGITENWSTVALDPGVWCSTLCEGAACLLPHHGSVKNGKRGACEQKAATVLPNRTAAA